jgi:hAT family C-terminal dimerisation region
MSELCDELERYLSTDPEQVTDVFQWWYERKGIYPRLHHMVLDYLTIPGVYFKPYLLSTNSLTIYLHV